MQSGMDSAARVQRHVWETDFSGETTCVKQYYYRWQWQIMYIIISSSSSVYFGVLMIIIIIIIIMARFVTSKRWGAV